MFYHSTPLHLSKCQLLMEELIVSSFVQIGKVNLNVPNHTLMRRRAMVNPDPCPSRPRPPPHHVLPPCECSVPPLSPPHLSPICFHPFLVLLCLPLVYMSASPSQCQHHCPGVGEAAVCTQQSGCFCLDCEAGGRDSQRSMGFLDASAKYPPSHSPFSGWHRLWDAQPGNFGLVVREEAEYHHL